MVNKRPQCDTYRDTVNTLRRRFAHSPGAHLEVYFICKDGRMDDSRACQTTKSQLLPRIHGQEICLRSKVLPLAEKGWRGFRVCWAEWLAVAAPMMRKFSLEPIRLEVSQFDAVPENIYRVYVDGEPTDIFASAEEAAVLQRDGPHIARSAMETVFKSSLNRLAMLAKIPEAAG